MKTLLRTKASARSVCASAHPSGRTEASLCCSGQPCPVETPCHRETIATGREHLRLNEGCIFSSKGQLLLFSLIPLVKPVSF